jgi:pyruvate formate lyase activating enzyme
MTSGHRKILGTIFNIQRFSIHDGPGIRTLVLLKGCPLRCKWCSNPEGQNSNPELVFISNKCVGADKCGAECLKVCPSGAINLSQHGQPVTNRKVCINCGKCVDACYYNARKIVGYSMTLDKVLGEIERDRPFYRISHGGVSFGGGEPLMQFDFVLHLLKRCKERFLNTALETCGRIPWGYLKSASRYVDLVYYDIKHMDSKKHKEITGVGNSLILRNAKMLFANMSQGQIIVRVPIIPGYSASEENMEDTSSFVKESGGKMIELLPYHKLGIYKYTQLDRKYELPHAEPPSDEIIERLRLIIRAHGLKDMTDQVL